MSLTDLPIDVIEKWFAHIVKLHFKRPFEIGANAPDVQFEKYNLYEKIIWTDENINIDIDKFLNIDFYSKKLNFSEEQTKALEKSFKNEKYLLTSEKIRLQVRTELTNKQITDWFKKRRYNEKRNSTNNCVKKLKQEKIKISEISKEKIIILSETFAKNNLIQNI